jgi:hypothetical protein
VKKRNPADDILVQHAHLTARLLVSVFDFLAEGRHLAPEFTPHRRKLSVHVGAKLQELRRQVGHFPG